MPMKYEHIKVDEILTVLLSFITNGADIIELFSNVDEETIFLDQSLAKSILGLDFIFYYYFI